MGSDIAMTMFELVSSKGFICQRKGKQINNIKQEFDLQYVSDRRHKTTNEYFKFAKHSYHI